MQKQPLENTSLSGSLYLICEKCPLDVYIDCWVDNDLKRLVITGAASDETLQKTWDKLFLQSLQISQSGTYNEVLEITKEIEDCKAKLTIVNNTVSHFILCNQHGIDNDIELIKVLDSLALRSQIKPEDRDNVLIKKLNSVIGRAKKWVDKITQLRKTMDEIKADNDGKKIDRVYFDNWLECISEEKGFFVKANEITVSRFYNSITRVREKAQKLEMAQNRQYA